MPDIEIYRRRFLGKGNTVGESHKYNSDVGMEMTWDTDIQSKRCYIYDYFHDDQPDKKDHITYENTTKTPIDAKFIITQYGSLNKDQVEYHLMFKPSEKIEFEQNDELYYFETNYRKRYSSDFPIGLYIDIPNERNIYEKWLICAKEIGNQFIKYSILPCNYYLQWLEKYGKGITKRKMWSVVRMQNSYTSGIWSGHNFTTLDNVNRIWLPMNTLTEYFSYTDNDDSNIRLIVSALMKNPLAWQISKVENFQPFGVLKLTIKQVSFNPGTDYVNLETGEMFADYYKNSIEALEDNINEIPVSNQDKLSCNITASTNNIKAGGSYKTLTVEILDKDGNDVTQNILENNDLEWSCQLSGNDITNSDLITWLKQPELNKIKIKFSENKTYLGEVLVINFNSTSLENNIQGEIQLEIIC